MKNTFSSLTCPCPCILDTKLGYSPPPSKKKKKKLNLSWHKDENHLTIPFIPNVP